MAKSKKPKLPRYITPRGVAVFPWLTKADTQFDERGVFKTDLRLDPSDNEATKFIKLVGEAAKEDQKKRKLKPAQIKKYHLPLIPEVNDDGDETGMVLVRTKTYATINGESRKLDIFDAVGKPYKGGAIYGGSELKLNVSPSGYTNGSNVGLTLYLNAVQVLKLVTAGGASAEAYGFEPEEDGFVCAETDGEEEEAGVDDDAEF